MATTAPESASAATDARRIAGTFAAKTDLTAADFPNTPHGRAAWHAARLLWCVSGLGCVCRHRCIGCDPTHHNPPSGEPFNYVPVRGGGKAGAHPGAPRSWGQTASAGHALRGIQYTKYGWIYIKQTQNDNPRSPVRAAAGCWLASSRQNSPSCRLATDRVCMCCVVPQAALQLR